MASNTPQDSSEDLRHHMHNLSLNPTTAATTTTGTGDTPSTSFGFVEIPFHVIGYNGHLPVANLQPGSPAHVQLCDALLALRALDAKVKQIVQEHLGRFGVQADGRYRGIDIVYLIMTDVMLGVQDALEKVEELMQGM